MVAFQNPDIQITSEDGDNAYPRILLTNSHDGMQAFKFSVGIFRLVCSNGLVVADEQFSDFKIKHKGYSFDELRNVVRQAVEDLPNKVKIMNDMKNRILTEEEKRKMALDAMLITFLTQLKPVTSYIHTLEISGQPAALSAQELAAAATRTNIPAMPANSLADALAKIKHTAPPETPVIICGSLYLAGHVLDENQTLPD